MKKDFLFTFKIKLQEDAIKRVTVIESEFDQLLENRMKGKMSMYLKQTYLYIFFVNLTLYSYLFILELSANDMEVWVFDTKRNAQVLKGRLEQEQHARRKEESMMDLELDFLAPYLQRIPDISSMTRGQALEVSIWKRIGSNTKLLYYYLTKVQEMNYLFICNFRFETNA